MAKPKVASDWLAGCAGCHMSFLDIDERIVALTELVDLRATPITDLKEPDESGVDVGILEGGISLARSHVGGAGYIDVGTNFVWIENSTVGRVSKSMIFEGGRLQCSGSAFGLESFITNRSGLLVDNSADLTISNIISAAAG